MKNLVRMPILFLGIACASVFLYGCGENHSASNTRTAAVSQQERKFVEVQAGTMLKDVKENALAASSKYNGRDIEIRNGVLSNIDSDGSYFSISSNDAGLSLSHIQCFMQNDEQRNIIRSMKIGQGITVYGRVTDVGEIKGYTVDVARIEAGDLPQTANGSTSGTQTDIVSDESSPVSPKDAFKIYHEYISNHQLSDAWNCLTESFRSNFNYESWRQGYSTTVRSSPSNIVVEADDGNRAVLSYKLRAVDNYSGRRVVQYFQGRCVLYKIDGIWKIDSIEASKI